MDRTQNPLTRFVLLALSCFLFCFASVQAEKLESGRGLAYSPPLTWSTSMIKPGCDVQVGVAAIEPWMPLVESVQAILACNSLTGGSPTLLTLFVNGSMTATPVDACSTIGTITLNPVPATSQVLVSCTDIDPSTSPSAALALSYDLPLTSSSVGNMSLSGNECQGATGVTSILVDWTSGNQFFICHMAYQADSVWMIPAGVTPGQPTQFFESAKCPSISTITLQYTSDPNSYGQILVGCNCTATQTDQYALVAVNVSGGAFTPFATPAQCSGNVQVYGSYTPGNMFFVACPSSSATIVTMYSPDWDVSTPLLTSADCSNPNLILDDPYSDWLYISCAGNQTVVAYDTALDPPYDVNTVSQPYSCTNGANQLSVSSTSAKRVMTLFVVCNNNYTLRVNMTDNVPYEASKQIPSLFPDGHISTA